MFGLEVSLLVRVGYRLLPQMCTITFEGKSFLRAISGAHGKDVVHYGGPERMLRVGGLT